MAEAGTRRSSMRISEWPVEPCMVSTSRTSVHPSDGMSTRNAELAAWEADRRARKEREKAHFFEHAEEPRRMWE